MNRWRKVQKGIVVIGILLWRPALILADRPRCGGHGTVAGCDAKSGRILCSDGSLDLRFPCTVPKQTQHKPTVQELRFKPATEHGQILSPGEKAPMTTLESASSSTITRSTPTLTPPLPQKP